MPNFTEGRYSADELRRNRVAIIVVAAIVIGLFGVLGAQTDWPWANAIASSAVALVFAAALWWMFASRKSGPVKLSKESQSYMSNLAQPWRKRD